MDKSKQSTEGVEEVLRGIWGLMVTQLKLRTFLVHKDMTMTDYRILCIPL